MIADLLTDGEDLADDFPCSGKREQMPGHPFSPAHLRDVSAVLITLLSCSAELPSRRCGCGGVSQRGKTMGSDGKSDANCWRVTSPAGPARLLKREEEDSLRPWVRQLLLTGRGSRWSASPPSGRQK